MPDEIKFEGENSEQMQNQFKKLGKSVSPHRKEELEKQFAMINGVTNSARSPEKVITKESKEDMEERRKKAADFVMKMKAQKQGRRKKEEERKKQIEDKLMKENEKYSKLFKKRQEEIMNRRKEESLRVYEQIKKKKEDEKKKLEEVKPRVHRVPEEEYLYKKLEQKYNAEILMPMLEEKKKELAQKRNKYKPINKEEIDEHMKMHDFLKAQKESERLNELKSRRETSQEIQKAIRHYKSSVMEKQIQEEKKQKEDSEKKRLEINDRKLKMDNYAKLIRETYTIRPNEDKIIELQKKIAKLKHPVRQPRDTRKDYNVPIIKRKPKPEVSSTENLPKPNLPPLIARSTSQVNQEASSFPSELSTSRRNYKGKNEQLVKRVTVRRDPKPTVDYLQKFRYKRELSNEAVKPSVLDWHSDLNDDLLNINEKYSRLMEKAKMIEEQAKRKEQLLNVRGEIDLGNNVSDMFIDAIKAKLAILENL